MPRPRKSVPASSHHKPTNQAYVRLPDGPGGRRSLSFGGYGSPESRAEYARVVAALVTPPAGRETSPNPAAEPDQADLTVNEILLAFWRHAEQHYRRADGSPTNELAQFRQT